MKKEKTDLATLEESYERETDENKQTKLEYKISRKEESINRLVDRQNVLLDRENKEGAKDNGKDKNEEEEEEEEEERKDEDVCETCGADLEFVGKDEKSGKDIFRCVECEELYIDE